MLVTNTILQGSQALIQATNSISGMVDKIQDRRTQRKMLDLEIGLNEIEKERNTLKNDPNFQPTKIDENGDENYDGYGSGVTSNGKTIEERYKSLERNLKRGLLSHGRKMMDRRLELAIVSADRRDQEEYYQKAGIEKEKIFNINVDKAIDIAAETGDETFLNNLVENSNKTAVEKERLNLENADEINYRRTRNQVMEAARVHGMAAGKLHIENSDLNTEKRKRLNNDLLNEQQNIESMTKLVIQQHVKTQEGMTVREKLDDWNEMIDNETNEDRKRMYQEARDNQQREGNHTQFNHDKNLVLSAGSVVEQLKKVEQLERLYREGAGYEANYERQDEQQATHHEWFLRKKDQLENEIKSTTARAGSRSEELKIRDMHRMAQEEVRRFKTGVEKDGMISVAFIGGLPLLLPEEKQKYYKELLEHMGMTIQDGFVKLDNAMTRLEEKKKILPETANGIRQEVMSAIFRGELNPENIEKEIKRRIETYSSELIGRGKNVFNPKEMSRVRTMSEAGDLQGLDFIQINETGEMANRRIAGTEDIIPQLKAHDTQLVKNALVTAPDWEVIEDSAFEIAAKEVNIKDENGRTIRTIKDGTGRVALNIRNKTTGHIETVRVMPDGSIVKSNNKGENLGTFTNEMEASKQGMITRVEQELQETSAVPRRDTREAQPSSMSEAVQNIMDTHNLQHGQNFVTYDSNTKSYIASNSLKTVLERELGDKAESTAGRAYIESKMKEYGDLYTQEMIRLYGEVKPWQAPKRR